MADFGGIIKFRLPDGRNLTVRGSVTHMPGRFSYEKIANHDGSLDRSVKPEGYEFALSLSNRAVGGERVDFDALMALEGVAFTFLHDAERVDRTFTGASLLGRPSVDDLTGEVSGVTGMATGFIEVPR
ncbi:tail tube protein [Microcystis phage vB_MweS-yong2]|nr:tail tube protein [Microcystis phage vB_MweS-yong2]